MNYYPFHIGDYASHTKGLTLMEDLAYRRLLDLYYTNERPFSGDTDEIAREIGMRDQLEAVAYILNKYFPNGENIRADAEIEAMKVKQQKQRDRANKRWNSAKEASGNATTDTPAMPRHNESDATVQESDAVLMPPTPTPTPTPTPSIKNTRSRNCAPVCPDDVDSQVWADWLAIRKAKRAPLTQTALDGLVREAAKAGLSTNQAIKMCAERGWQSFKAEWVDRKTPLKGFELGDAIGREWLLEQGEGNGYLD